MPSFSGPIHNFKQQNLTEEQNHCETGPNSCLFEIPDLLVLPDVFDSSPALGRGRVRTAGPYQVYGSARRALREGHFGSQLHLTFVDALDGDYYGRNCKGRVSFSSCTFDPPLS